MKVTVETKPELNLAAISHRGPYLEIGPAFGKLDQIVKKSRLTPEGLVAVYFDDPRTTPEDRLRSAAAVIVKRDDTLVPGLEPQTLPAGPYARAVHLGPYEGLGEAWAEFRREAAQQTGRQVGPGATYERYLNTPADTAPEQLKTELFLPLL